MEFNKIVGAGLLAVLIAWLAGFAADKLVKPEMLEQAAFKIEGVISTAHAAEAAAPAAEAAAPAAELPPIGPLLTAADPAKGQQVAKVCAACHDFTKDGPNKVGPNLWGVVGRSRGAVAGYAYSAAMKSIGGEWSVEHLNAYLAKPRQDIPGNKMAYPGMAKPEDRAAVIAFLQSLK
jgi:cytochrome c